MPEYDASDAEILIYARRQPDTVLSSMGHDIKIRAEEFTIDADFEEGRVDAEIRADALKPVDAIIWESKEETGELSEGDRHEISQRMEQDVLEVDQYPAIAFHSTTVDETDDGWHVEGTVELHGEEHAVAFDAARGESQATVETTIDHTDWGIEQYSAMLGSLKVAPELEIVVHVPLPTNE